jgi:hypothetical protein
MTRGVSATNLAAADALHVRPLLFVRLVFASATLRLHLGVGTYSFDSNTFTGVGGLGSISPLEEGLELSPYSITMELWALEPTILAEASAETLFNAGVTIWLGFLDDNGQLVDTPHVIWTGYADHASISLGGERDLVTLVCESELRFLDQANGARFTDEDQQARYSGDVALEYLPQMVDAAIVWGPGGTYTRFGSPPTPRNGDRNPTPPRGTPAR